VNFPGAPEVAHLLPHEIPCSVKSHKVPRSISLPQNMLASLPIIYQVTQGLLLGFRIIVFIKFLTLSEMRYIAGKYPGGPGFNVSYHSYAFHCAKSLYLLLENIP